MTCIDKNIKVPGYIELLQLGTSNSSSMKHIRSVLYLDEGAECENNYSDVEFQSKAMGKMNEISMIDGKTIIFVSHNIKANYMDKVATCAGSVVGNAAIDYMLGDEKAFNDAIKVFRSIDIKVTFFTVTLLGFRVRSTFSEISHVSRTDQ